MANHNHSEEYLKATTRRSDDEKPFQQITMAPSPEKSPSVYSNDNMAPKLQMRPILGRTNSMEKSTSNPSRREPKSKVSSNFKCKDNELRRSAVNRDFSHKFSPSNLTADAVKAAAFTPAVSAPDNTYIINGPSKSVDVRRAVVGSSSLEAGNDPCSSKALYFGLLADNRSLPVFVPRKFMYPQANFHQQFLPFPAENGRKLEYVNPLGSSRASRCRKSKSAGSVLKVQEIATDLKNRKHLRNQPEFDTSWKAAVSDVPARGSEMGFQHAATVQIPPLEGAQNLVPPSLIMNPHYPPATPVRMPVPRYQPPILRHGAPYMLYPPVPPLPPYPPAVPTSYFPAPFTINHHHVNQIQQRYYNPPVFNQPRYFQGGRPVNYMPVNYVSTPPIPIPTGDGFHQQPISMAVNNHGKFEAANKMIFTHGVERPRNQSIAFAIKVPIHHDEIAEVVAHTEDEEAPIGYQAAVDFVKNLSE